MTLFRPAVERLEGYTPGEQPQGEGWTKLNTNENPYPSSPRVVAALELAAEGRLNIYPDPLATRFRETAAAAFGVDADWILPGNGSDEVLTILMRSFVDAGETVSSPYPSYILYETLAGIQGAAHERLQLNADWSWNPADHRAILQRSKLVFVPNPNSPSGTRWNDDDIRALIPPGGVLVLDEAYGEFCDEPHRGELLRGEQGDRIVLTRTLSKSHSLAGIRLGFAVAHPDLIRGMRKVKDSYNCDTLSLAAGVAALEDAEWVARNITRIRATRARLTAALRDLGFDVTVSQANFVWTTHPDGAHHSRYQSLKDRRILVRYMRFRGAGADGKTDLDGLRITVGTDEEIDRLLEALQSL